MQDLRDAASSFRFGRCAELLPHSPLRSECVSMSFYDRHSSLMACEYRELRDKVFAYCDSRKADVALWEQALEAVS